MSRQNHRRLPTTNDEEPSVASSPFGRFAFSPNEVGFSVAFSTMEINFERTFDLN
jgi:hypothetical protein